MKARGASRLLTVLAIVVTGLGLAAPPAAAAPAVTVTPATGLLDRSIVSVHSQGLTPGAQYLVTQCAGAAPAGCALDPPVNQNGTIATANSNGVVQVTLRLPRLLDLAGGDVDCSAGTCAIAVLTNQEKQEVVRTSIDFEATGTAPPPPEATLAISVSDMRADGGTAAWSGSGYLPWFRASQIATDEPLPISLAPSVSSPGAYIAICTAPPSGWAGCERYVSPLTQVPGSSGAAFKLHQWVPVAGNGTATAASRLMPRMWQTEDGRIDCAVADCSFALEQDGAPHSNVVDVAWRPEWAPYPSANAFVTAAYSALLRRAATTSERSAAVAGLTARSTTGFDLLLDLAGRADARRLAELTRLYLAALGRGPDGPGLLYWERELRRTGSMSAIAAAFGRSPEFRKTYVTGVSDSEAVTLAYERTLGRTPANGERAYWVGRLRDGLSRTRMIHMFSRTPEFLDREDGRSRATAVMVALLGRGPTWDEWVLSGPDSWARGDHRTYAERVDDAVLSVLSSDQLVGAVG